MGFTSFRPPPFDLDEWKAKPHLERIKPLAQDWAVNGFGTPTEEYLGLSATDGTGNVSFTTPHDDWGAQIEFFTHIRAGVQTKAAELLRMSFRSFRYYAKKYNLVRREDLYEQAEPAAPREAEGS